MSESAQTRWSNHMGTRTWRTLKREKRQRSKFRITLLVRGREIVKVYDNEEAFKKWMDAFEENRKRENSGIEHVKGEMISQ